MIERLIDRHINDHIWLQQIVWAVLHAKYRIKYRKQLRSLRRAWASLDRAKAELDRKITAFDFEKISDRHANHWHRLVAQAKREGRTPLEIWSDQGKRRAA